ncbi:MAG TPA: sugar-binding domain-containing protein [Anaeromyxobacter sp.]|nr:sugar-binding domain-containing protein [Anaeromyxobacter sp.]
MSSRLDVQLVVKVAQMYYLDGLKQEQIAKQIGISRSLISMILTEAKERGIVEITVRDPFLNDDDLSRRLSTLHPATRFTVIPTSSRDPTARRKLVAQRAADMLARSLEGGEVVGLAWGRTCLEFVQSFRPAGDDRLEFSIVPLIGGSSQTAPYFQINEMVRVLAERSGGTPYFIHAPALVTDREERDLHLSTSSMQPIRQKWRQMDIVVTAIGALGGDHPDRESYMGETEMFRHLDAREAVGDICARYFDRRGRFVVDDYYERVVGVPAEALKGAKTALCMASGMEKVEAIAGALKTGVAKQLVLDEPTARAELEFLSGEKG